MQRTLSSLFVLLVSCSLLAAPVTITKKGTQQRFPDGTVIEPWFLDATAPVLSDLGTAYRLDDYGIISSPYQVQTEAIQQLIDRAAADGGGVIVVPEGIYKSGSGRDKERSEKLGKDHIQILGAHQGNSEQRLQSERIRRR